MEKINLQINQFCQLIFTRNKLKKTAVFFIMLLFFVTTPLITYAQVNEKISVSTTQEKYSKVTIKTDIQQFEKMNEAIGFDHVHLEKDGSFTGEFSQSEIAQMIKLGAKVNVLVPDIVSQLKASNNERLISDNSTNLLPAGFTYGTMGGYLTYAEIVAKLDQLRALYPNLISVKQSIGKSTENRDLWVVRISNNPDVDQNSKPKVFFNALTHAREPAGMMQLIYYMCTLLQNYNTDPEAKFLIDNREIYFMPCVNPDGYEYNRSTNPSGGGMWRKNRYKECTVTTTVSNCRDIKVRRCDTVWNAAHTSYTLKNCKDIKIGRVCDTTRTTNCTVYGVDLNRNFSYKWGYNTSGSSTSKTSSTYRGPSAFSEPETKAIRDFSYLKNFKMVMNQHTPGNQLVYPYNYANDVVPDQGIYNMRNTLLTETNGLLIGHMLTTAGYYANGESSDWQYGEKIAKPKAYAWTPELGESFWPVQSLIETLCIRMLRTDLNMTWIAGEYFRYSAPAGLTATNTNFTVPVTIINYGENAGTIEKIQYVSTDGHSSGNDSVALSGINIGATVIRNLAINLSSYTGSGIANGVLRITYTGGYTQDKAFSFNYNLPSGLRKNETNFDAKKINESYSVFPNPTGNLFQINSKNNEVPTSVSVYDLNGTLMTFKQNTNVVDLSDFANGVYTIQIETMDGMINKKIIKQ